jgi:hypothetical protein
MLWVRDVAYIALVLGPALIAFTWPWPLNIIEWLLDIVLLYLRIQMIIERDEP